MNPCHQQSSKPISVFVTDCPRSVKVSASNGTLDAGDVLTCESDGDPEPSYTWTDDDGHVVYRGPTVTLTQSHYKLICTATSNFTAPCNASEAIYNTTITVGT